jgi:hypothetical protein
MKFSLAPDLLRLKRADVLLLALSFATAICDVATFNELGIFVSNQVSRFKTSFFSISEQKLNNNGLPDWKHGVPGVRNDRNQES